MSLRVIAGVFLCAVLPAAIGARPAPAVPGPAPSMTCRVQFPGTAFLRAAAQRGLAPKQVTPCYQVQTANNTFHARPQSPCTLLFRNGEWLPGGATFRGMEGQGSFTAGAESGGFRVTISPGGGFYLSRVSIAVVGPFTSCTDVKLEYVLDGG